MITNYGWSTNEQRHNAGELTRCARTGMLGIGISTAIPSNDQNLWMGLGEVT
jgi:hypothetical protein